MVPPIRFEMGGTIFSEVSFEGQQAGSELVAHCGQTLAFLAFQLSKHIKV